ncbi:integral membrane protein, YjbE family [Schinkia azotoformans MEV2011]|uniref:Integral membrane protein n=2 Tax=Schinkia azotoformans TaxID=1454 RepID=K6CT10_SCHAZ|nr:TerC family protein [Schinkia azotoformans]EKN63392.1 integral membrane protein [Schinkia azotoformans LMG 9581]KEF38349.1 integral membrane protein, YjbE family [Schinkia azotoformans MEV2011]MEC1638691.1 TerC family protein [Schinkia azotoformans]MEC1694092.1 TerC family protein [Schinkia azotoformans]MEC1719250.1 TerC family protein [Schinkia azotoformans]
MDLELLSQILIIIGIDIVLGGDNAIVIALACRNLPVDKRNKAILLGTGLAIIVRIALTIIAVYLLMIPFLQLVGGLFLIYIAYNLLTEDGDDVNKIRGGTTLFQAVRTIVVADLVMGFDNVLAVAGAAGGKIILVVAGLLISIPIIVWGSKIILKFMERFPIIIYIGAGILALTAGKMITHEERIQPFLETYSFSYYIIPLITIVFVLLAGLIKKTSTK